MKTCPACKLINPDLTLHCDCDHPFLDKNNNIHNKAEKVLVESIHAKKDLEAEAFVQQKAKVCWTEDPSHFGDIFTPRMDRFFRIFPLIVIILFELSVCSKLIPKHNEIISLPPSRLETSTSIRSENKIEDKKLEAHERVYAPLPQSHLEPPVPVKNENKIEDEKRDTHELDADPITGENYLEICFNQIIQYLSKSTVITA